MHTDLEQTTDQPLAARPVSRRAAVQFLGLGAGAVAVAGSGALTWLATTGGVFSTGTGAAYGEMHISLGCAVENLTLADPQQAADDFCWYRSSWHDVQTHKDGITIDPSGQSPLIRAVSKLLPTTQKQDNDGWLRGTRDTQLPTADA